MKRVLTILAILLLPLSVWAMTPVSDSDLSNVTGQAGVNINADLTMDIGIGTMAWGDSDGIVGVYDTPFATVDAGGYVGLNDFNITDLRIRARTETSDDYNSYSTTLLKPITIDVATGSKNGVADVTFVRFGLGALHISMAAMSFDVALGSHVANDWIGTQPVLDQTLGTVSMGGMEVYISPWSYVDIYNDRADGIGVNFDFNVILDRVAFGYLSWGDGDGFGSYGSAEAPAGFYWANTNTAGYVGMNNFTIGDGTAPAVTITGTMAIDVYTTSSDTSVYAALPAIMRNFSLAMYAASLDPHDYDDVTAFIASQGIAVGTPLGVILADQGWEPDTVSVVHMSFTDMNIVVGPMWSDIIVGDTNDFTNINGNLGDIYLEGLDVMMNGWVDIWAH